jgi:catechol 2,3-dioxygenase-like lactoylglutathione lyase family enzyme
MTVQGIDHLFIETRDFERSVAFWQTLGFRLVEQWGEGGYKAGLLRSEMAVVVLAPPRADSAPAEVTVHFRVADADATARQLAESGASDAIETPPEDTHWGTRWLRVRDPEGHVFALEQAAVPAPRA